jgi:hypothetical protein
MDGWRLDKSIDKGRERWMEGGREGGWADRWMKGWMIEWMDGGMDGVSKNIKIGDYILYAKTIYEAKREKNILEKNEKTKGIDFFFVKKKSKLKEEKGENWRFLLANKKYFFCLWKTRLQLKVKIEE